MHATLTKTQNPIVDNKEATSAKPLVKVIPAAAQSSTLINPGNNKAKPTVPPKPIGLSLKSKLLTSNNSDSSGNGSSASVVEQKTVSEIQEKISSRNTIKSSSSENSSDSDEWESDSKGEIRTSWQYKKEL